MTPALRSFWFDSGRTHLFCAATGDGTPIVFLHGGLGDHRASLFHLGPLSPGVRWITPDVRGAGRSVYSEALSWDLLADDVVALLDHLGLAQAVIAGTSAGSGIALRTALRHPQRVERLVLVSPVFAGTRRGLTDEQRHAFAGMHAAALRTLDHGIEALEPLFDPLPESVRTVALEMVRSFDPRSVVATTEFLASDAQPFDALEELRAVRCPTWVVPGMDAEHPRELALELVRWFDQGRVVEGEAGSLATVVAGRADRIQ